MRPEDALQIGLVNWLRLVFNGLVYANMNGAWLAGSAKQRGMLVNHYKKMGLLNGVPDLTLLWQGGVAYVELKTPDRRDKLTDGQDNFLSFCNDNGIPATVCTSERELREFMIKHNIPTRIKL